MKLLRTKRVSRQDGFTLIEVLVSMLIMGIVSAMMVGIWIVLTHAAAFARADNTAASTARDALDRVSAELRSAQPPATINTTPFVFTLSSPYVCDGYDCTFFSAYNNALTKTQSGINGEAQVLRTSLYLDTSGSTPQKKLYWIRDTNADGTLNPATDKRILLASNVVNTASSINKPIFTYVFCDASNNYTTSNSLTSTTVKNLVAVNLELVVDANLNDKPTYIDLVSTVRPHNQGTSH